MTIEEFLDRLRNVRKAGAGWSAQCPTHEDRRNSLSIRSGTDGRILFTCFADCEKRHILTALDLEWSDVQPASFAPIPGKPRAGRLTLVAKRAHAVHDDPRRTETALRIWRDAEPAAGTIVERYLRARGIDIGVPSTLRYRPGLKHASGGSWPAMVALVTRGADDEAIAIHRTFLSRHGGQKAPVEPQKMMLGPCRGGAVRLAPVTIEPLMVGEGIETCLAAMQATGRPAWAALSTSGLRALDLPPKVREIIILADGDDAGATAAEHAALRWSRQGRRVRIARPPRELDFNDVLLGRTRQHSEGTA
jgi:putative DNA primase/helicase